MIDETKLYASKYLSGVVRIISMTDTTVEIEDVNTYEIMKLSISTFEQEFEPIR